MHREDAGGRIHEGGQRMHVHEGGCIWRMHGGSMS